MNIKIKKFSFIYFINLYSKVKKKQDKVSNKFGVDFEKIRKDTVFYDIVQKTVSKCDQVLKLLDKRNVIIQNLIQIEEKIEQLPYFGILSNFDMQNFRELIEQFICIREEKKQLCTQLLNFQKNIGYLDKIEEDANFALDKIEDSENQQKIFRQDISYLKGEKSYLEYEKIKFEKILFFIAKFQIITYFVLFLNILICFHNYIAKTKQNFIYLFFSIIFAGIFYVVKSKFINKLKINVKMQNKAVKLLNKKNIVMIYHTNFLQYEYQKYKINNSKVLKNNLKNLQQFRFLNKRYDFLKSRMYEIEKNYDNFLNKKDLEYRFEEDFSDINIVKNKLKTYDKLLDQKSILIEDLKKLEQNYEEIWKNITHINLEDASQNKIIQNIMQNCLKQIEE